MSESEIKPLRLADLSWWRQWLAEPAVFWLEWVVPRDKPFELGFEPIDTRTLSEEVLRLEDERRERKRRNAV